MFPDKRRKDMIKKILINEPFKLGGRMPTTGHLFKKIPSTPNFYRRIIQWQYDLHRQFTQDFRKQNPPYYDPDILAAIANEETEPPKFDFTKDNDEMFLKNKVPERIIKEINKAVDWEYNRWKNKFLFPDEFDNNKKTNHIKRFIKNRILAVTSGYLYRRYIKKPYDPEMISLDMQTFVKAFKLGGLYHHQHIGYDWDESPLERLITDFDIGKYKIFSLFKIEDEGIGGISQKALSLVLGIDDEKIKPLMQVPASEDSLFMDNETGLIQIDSIIEHFRKNHLRPEILRHIDRRFKDDPKSGFLHYVEHEMNWIIECLKPANWTPIKEMGMTKTELKELISNESMPEILTWRTKGHFIYTKHKNEHLIPIIQVKKYLQDVLKIKGMKKLEKEYRSNNPLQD